MRKAGVSPRDALMDQFPDMAAGKGDERERFDAKLDALSFCVAVCALARALCCWIKSAVDLVVEYIYMEKKKECSS